MSKNNIIVFPQADQAQGERVHKAIKEPSAPISSVPMGENVIPWDSKRPLQTLKTAQRAGKRKTPSYNPYKDWEKAQNKKLDNLIDGTGHWPAVPPNAPPPPPSKAKPYVFAGTGLSFLLVAGALLLGQGNKGDEMGREIASADYYRPSIKIIKNGLSHHVTLSKNENGRLAISLMPEEDLGLKGRSPDSLSSKLHPKEAGGDPNSVLLKEKKAKKSKRKPDSLHSHTKNLKQVWREQEQRALYLINTGQRRIISIGQ